MTASQETNAWKPLDPTSGLLGTGGRYGRTPSSPQPRPAVPPVRTTVPSPPVPAAPPSSPSPRPAARRQPTVRPDVPALHPETVRGRIVAAVALCESRRGASPITTADVVLRAWRMWPEVFGLRGYERSHPDANRVAAKLSGRGGVIDDGWISRPAPGILALTNRGARWWREVGAPSLASREAP